jgi:hypothetical protein
VVGRRKEKVGVSGGEEGGKGRCEWWGGGRNWGRYNLKLHYFDGF